MRHTENFPASFAGKDTTQLPDIERELARKGVSFSFLDPAMERAFQLGQQNGARFINRVSISLAVALFDAFFIPELRQMPEVLAFSAFLRFGLITPALLLFLVLDWRGRIGRWYPAVVCGLLIAPTLLAVVESIKVTSPLAVPNYQATPLLLLVVLTCRVSLRQAFIVNVTACVLYIGFVLTANFIPPVLKPSLILTDLAVGVAALVFAWRFDVRDRQVFLFSLQAKIGQELLAAQNRMLARLSQVDALTGLGNRRCFDEALATVWQAAAAAPLAVTLVIFDIDCFKQFNDALGHQAGDECLGAVARTVARCVRDEHDTLVRYGGEEFAILLPRTGLEEGVALAERVRQAVLARALPHPGGGAHHLVTVSLGVATVWAPEQTAASLIEAADQLLYEAKRRGRNCVASGATEARLPVKLGLA
jgi:diguanylate cyclase (GGDEF)-like protein